MYLWYIINIKKGLYFSVGLFLFLVNFSSYAQVTTATFEGIIHIGKKESYPYSITLKIDSNKATGYSIFNSGRDNETKSLLHGKFEKNRFEFAEYKIISTKTKEPIDRMCYIHYTGTLKKILSTEAIAGKFKGFYKSGKKCAEGTINFLNREKANKKLDSFYRDKKRDTLIHSPVLNKFLTAIPIEKRDNEETKIFWKSDSIKFIIWDHDKVDNDKLSIKINGRSLTTLNLTEKNFEFKDEIFSTITIEIKAINVGFFPPNTSKLLFLDEKETYYFSNNLNENMTVKYTIIK